MLSKRNIQRLRVSSCKLKIAKVEHSIERLEDKAENRLSSGCCNKVPQAGWLKQQMFISHSCGGWKSKISVLAWLGSWWGPSSWFIEGYLLAVSSRGRKRELVNSLASSYKGTYPIKVASPSWPNHLPEAAPPNTITLGFQHMSWGGWDTDIRAIATIFPRKQLKKERKSRSEKIRIVKGFTVEAQCLTNRNSKKQELEKKKRTGIY